MSSPYQDSYGEDTPGYWDVEEDLAVWRFGSPQGNLWYDWDEHVWKCRCRIFVNAGACKHAYRYRRQVTIMVRGEYL